MASPTVVKGVFVAVPLVLLLLKLVPLRWPLRLPLALAGGLAGGIALVALLGPGTLSYLVSFCIMASIYAILTLGLNTQWGFNGHLNFGIAGFFAIGAFTTALVTTAEPTGTMATYTQQAFGLEAPFLVGVLAGGAVSGVIAFLIAIPVLRLRMDFLAIATIGIAEIIRLIFQNERWLANGPQPLRGIPRPLHCLLEEPACGPAFLTDWLGALEARDYTFLYLALVTLFLAAIYLLLESALRSPWGRTLRAVRDEEASAAMNGKNIVSLRIQSFVVGAVVMGLGGALYAHYTVTIDYSHFRPLFSTFIIWVMLMLGGSGNNKGAMLGAFIIWGVWSGTAFLTGLIEPTLAAIHPALPDRSSYLRWMLVAVLLAGIVLFRPQGLIPEDRVVSRFLGRLRNPERQAQGAERPADGPAAS